MANSFDFNKLKPKTMTVTLSDKEKTTLLVMTPSKGLRDDLVNLYENIENTTDNEELEEALYDVASRVMSRNKQGKYVSPVTLKELYPEPEYIMAFLNAYVDFIGSITQGKN